MIAPSLSLSFLKAPFFPCAIAVVLSRNVSKGEKLCDPPRPGRKSALELCDNLGSIDVVSHVGMVQDYTVANVNRENHLQYVHLHELLSTALARRIIAGSGVRTTSALHIVVADTVAMPAIPAVGF